jgi:ABC-type amino acid transport substrate-binding protein
VVLVVRKGKIKSLKDLKGKTIAVPYNGPPDWERYLQTACVPKGEKASQFFGNKVIPRDTDYALDDLFDGQIDAAVMDKKNLEAYQEKTKKSFPDRSAGVEALQISIPFPAGVVAYDSNQVTPEEAQRVREQLIEGSAEHAEKLQGLGVRSLAEVPKDYDEHLKAYEKELKRLQEK